MYPGRGGWRQPWPRGPPWAPGPPQYRHSPRPEMYQQRHLNPHFRSEIRHQVQNTGTSRPQMYQQRPLNPRNQGPFRPQMHQQRPEIYQHYAPNNQPGPSSNNPHRAEPTKNLENLIDLPKRTDDPDYDDSYVILDWYISDLNLLINEDDFCSAKAISVEGFAYLWAGVKATYGVTSGKVCYEVSITNNQSTTHLVNEPNPHVIRCGWSVQSASLQLGIEPLSYGYGGTAKSSTDGKFQNYGIRFGVGDVIGCFIDFTNDPIIISYSVNGNYQGVAFSIKKSELNGQALFPHIMTKNQDFKVNFGQLDQALFPLPPNYVPIGQLEMSEVVRGPKAPRSKKECEVIQMVGLPGAGKTYWANQLAKKHPEKYYNILGTNTLIDKMKVMGLTRNRNYSGRWDMLINLCTPCFDLLMKIAKTRRRNLILDQTNVYPSARCRKMKDFSDYSIKTVVVVPNDAEYITRCQSRDQEEGKSVPQEAILNMKANFVLPDVLETYGQIFYVELGPAEAFELVKNYNEEAWRSGCNMTKGVKDFVSRTAFKKGKDTKPIGSMWPEEVHLEARPDTRFEADISRVARREPIFRERRRPYQYHPNSLQRNSRPYQDPNVQLPYNRPHIDHWQDPQMHNQFFGPGPSRPDYYQ